MAGKGHFKAIIHCSICGQDKPRSEFYAFPHYPDRVNSTCKVCSVEIGKKYAKKISSLTDEQRPKVPEKKCRGCGEVKAISEFYKNRYVRDGFGRRCKACESPKIFKQGEKRKEIRKVVRLAKESLKDHSVKRCPSCGAEKPRSEFYPVRSSPGKIHHDCKECSRKKSREYREHNPEKVAAADKRWAENNKERARKNVLAFRERLFSNPERLAEKRLYLRLKAAERNARMRSSGGSFTEEEWLSLCLRSGGKCLCCGSTDKKLTVDHVMPIDMGGSNYIHNIQPLCQNCNSRKSARMIDYRPWTQDIDEIGVEGYA